MNDGFRAAAPASGAPPVHARVKAVLMLADGTVFEGVAFGAPVSAVGEVCFNTAMTGYQEILADPSYAGQIIAFTFPHIGIVGANDEDIESINPAVRGVVVRAYADEPSNYRAAARLERWLKRHQVPRIAGVLLSNGPGDPAATGTYSIPMIRDLIDTEIPLFGICLGHQMLGLALGGRTRKMAQGHHGANHPVKDLETGKVEIVSMNHGFTVDRDTLPRSVKETHVSLFDGTNCGLKVEGRSIFSVQYHPEASPGPMDSHYLFERFAALAG